MWNLRNKDTKQRQKTRLLNTENKLMVARGEVGAGIGEKGEGD